MLAAEAGHKGVVEKLLANRADPGLLNRKREKAVALAAGAGHEDIAQLLTERDDTGFWLLKGF
jgi:ankyrin repeat protein